MRSKYKAIKCEMDGITFDSKLERNRYAELKMREKIKLIEDLQLQPKFPLVINGKDVVQRSDRFKNGRRVSYFADFSYVQDGIKIVEDTKGMDTPVSKLKRAIVEAIYDINITIVKSAKE